ncbi:hypothetical protein A2U01_0096386, partial [Trifolium medium]|nr:hypothetical protein [Trifolium medium]
MRGEEELEEEESHRKLEIIEIK